MFEELQASRRTLEALSQGPSSPRSWPGTIAHQISIRVIVLWHLHQVLYRYATIPEISLSYPNAFDGTLLGRIQPTIFNLLFIVFVLQRHVAYKVVSFEKIIVLSVHRDHWYDKNILGVWRNGCIRSIDEEDRGPSKKRGKRTSYWRSHFVQLNGGFWHPCVVDVARVVDGSLPMDRLVHRRLRGTAMAVEQDTRA